ncbi:hypothetical protein N7475_002939 [Penicillium sp. IBT 31633x]|nr:hypothetical protein N7475_002939 [Penicillium sp. IBT 31633x]
MDRSQVIRSQNGDANHPDELQHGITVHQQTVNNNQSNAQHQQDQPYAQAKLQQSHLHQEAPTIQQGQFHFRANFHEGYPPQAGYSYPQNDVYRRVNAPQNIASHDNTNEVNMKGAVQQQGNVSTQDNAIEHSKTSTSAQKLRVLRPKPAPMTKAEANQTDAVQQRGHLGTQANVNESINTPTLPTKLRELRPRPARVAKPKVPATPKRRTRAKKKDVAADLLEEANLTQRGNNDQQGTFQQGSLNTQDHLNQPSTLTQQSTFPQQDTFPQQGTFPPQVETTHWANARLEELVDSSENRPSQTFQRLVKPVGLYRHTLELLKAASDYQAAGLATAFSDDTIGKSAEDGGIQNPEYAWIMRSLHANVRYLEALYPNELKDVDLGELGETEGADV